MKTINHESDGVMVKIHETIHALQWTEVTSVAFVLLAFFFGL